MRITLEIDEDVLDAARQIADRDTTTIGQVVSELARAALAQRVDVRYHGWMPVFDVPTDGGSITNQTVRDALAEP